MSSPDFSHIKVLIVDDAVHMRLLIRSLLQSLGVRHVFEAENGAKGFEELRAHRPDVILTDLSMKPVDGIEFTRKVRNDRDSPNPYVPVIMVTGHTERARVTAARDAGVSEFLAKPITVQNILSRMTEIVERPRPFVRCANYFGPDRRRRRDENYRGQMRRKDDVADDITVD